MGNAGNKMATNNRVVQIVKAHQRLIKFPDRKAAPRPNVQEALKSVKYQALSSSTQGMQPAASSSVSVPRSLLSGPRDTVEIVRSLPQKYRRQPVSVEEMEYIQRGGPE